MQVDHEPIVVQAHVTKVEAQPIAFTPGNCCPQWGKTERAARANLTAIVGKERVIQVTGTAWAVLAADVVEALEKRKTGATARLVPRDEDEAAAVQAGLRVVGGRR